MKLKLLFECQQVSEINLNYNTQKVIVKNHWTKENDLQLKR